MHNKQTLFDVVLITLVGLVVFTFFSGSYQLISPDEGRYIEVAREMITSGNFITPHLDGTVFLDKPILFYWIEAGLIKLFGLNEWSVRLLPAFFACFGCMLTYWAGAELFNRRTGLFAAFIQMSMLLYFILAHYCNMDLMVAVLVSGALYLFLMGVQGDQPGKRRVYLLLSYSFAGFAFLAKGLIGLVFPIMIIGIWIVLQSRWQVVRRMCLVPGLLLFTIIVLPWLLLVERSNSEFFYYFFAVQQFSRYLSTHFNNQMPFYFYVPVILAGAVPWTLFLVQSLVFNVKQVWGNLRSNSSTLFLILWPLLIFLFFSLPKSKIVGYSLPIFPPLALLIARYFDERGQILTKSLSLKICGFIMLVFAVVVSLVLLHISSVSNLTTSARFVYLSAIAAFIISGSVLSVAAAYCSSRFSTFFIMLVITAVLTEMITVASLQSFSWFAKHVVVKQMAHQIKENLEPVDKVVVFDHYFQDLPVYLQHHVYVVADWSARYLQTHDNWRRELAEGVLYKHYRQPWLLNYQQFVELWQQQRGRIFILTSKGNVSELKRLIRPVYLLQSKNGVFLFSNIPVKLT